MKITIRSNEDVTEKELEEDASAFYSELGKILSGLPVPNDVTVTCPYGKAEYSIVSRSGTRFIAQKRNTITVPQKKPFPPKYLVMVNADHNNYKFYKLEQSVAGGDVSVTYGRIGANAGELYGARTCTYPADMFWVKYFEKTSKGYEDKSDIYLEPAEEKEPEKEPESDETEQAVNRASARLYSLLKGFAKAAVEAQTTVRAASVTESMVKESRKLLNILYGCLDVAEFNRNLMELLGICPRRVANVKDLLAKNTGDFPHIIDREEALVDAMEALVSRRQPSKQTVSSKDSFECLGIEVYEANEKQKEQVMRALDESLHGKVKNIYRVINREQQTRFDTYLKEHDIKKVKQLWHGSRNENWLSIIINGLLLKPNAIITGKMFGNGIYFAPKSTKSWNYTSFRNTYWAKGNSDMAFMALYATAYGTPLDCACAHPYTKREIESQGCNCVHAHAGSQLRNDEIIYYDEAAMTINYIVEFGA